jgi:ATP-binding cassette subfamily B protein
MVKLILDSLQAGRGMEAVYAPLLAIVAATAAGGLLLYFQRLWVISASRKIEYELRRDLFAGLMHQPKRFFDAHSIGDIMSKSTNDLDRLRDMAGPVVLHLARMGCLLAYTTVALWQLNPRLMWLGLLPSLMMPLLANVFLKRMYGLFGGIQKSLSSLNNFNQDTLSGIQVVKAYGKHGEFQERFASTSAELRDTSLKVSYFNSAIWPTIGVLGAIGLVLVAWLGGRMVIREEITLGTLSAAILYLLRLQFPLVGLGWVASMIQRANVSIDRLSALRRSFLVEPPTVQGSALPDGTGEWTVKSAEAVSASGAPRAAPSFDLIEARNLSFAYDGSRKVLEGINLAIPAGSSLGIVGPTGSGKTTLMQILCGIYPPPPGTLFLDGVAREGIPDAEWIRHFTYAPQDGFLFSNSIRSNISMGDANDSVRDGHPTVEEVGEWSALSRDLPQFPQGYDSMLGEKGINLSGGQRQRVGLARAMMAGAPALALDDTLSALDTETESLVLEQIRSRFAGHTLLVVSHRYSAVMGCDNIVFLKDGRIVEQGDHASLLKRGGAYAAVWERQKLTHSLERA